jgi:hypothetical protein
VQSVEVVHGGDATEDLPFLPMPGLATDLRFLSARGHMRKAIPLGGMQYLPLTLRSQVPGKASWQWQNPQGQNHLDPQKAVLFDSSTGAAYQNGDSLVLNGTKQGFTLVLGPRSGVESAEQAWQRRAQSSLRFQVPWVLRGRQQLELAFDWPREQAQNGASLEVRVTDSQGRHHLLQTLRPRGVGAQSYAWPRPSASGSYVVSIAIKGQGRSSVWQQKCTVLP